MTREELIDQIKEKRTFLCVGLDTDLQKIPKHLLDCDDPVFEFNKVIIDATKDLCVAYKPNIAFYEMLGPKGWESLKKTIEYIPSNIFTIADAKRGDIGNTSGYYANTFFNTYDFDAVTIAPYMGSDSVTPFLAHTNKWAIVLAMTSNVGGLDFQFQKDQQGERLFEKVIKKSMEWGNDRNTMLVVGATRADLIDDVRKIAPDTFLLVPGVGAQGGSLEDVVHAGMNKDCGLLVNSSRGIIYASDQEDFGQVAREKALGLQKQMELHLANSGVIH
ncbi:MAG: orotidine-5'-phosphate decarboxylase [Crocinitomicaceae bacterium]|nr:orotidine-5'-phosphate decarboxylase [Crocinitomicaceae bacterium]